jgi:adenylate cyclase
VVQAKTTTERRWRKTALVVAALVVLGVGVVAVWNFFIRSELPSIEAASMEKMAFPLPDKPSIAVLPFDNLSGDPDQDYIADGITENIITALSKIPQMFVIARTSTLTYKGKPVTVKQVSEELGVRYVLEGSVQKEGDRVRITPQLVDAIKGHHLWAEQYDRDMKGFFALLDELTKEIGAALQVQLTWGDYASSISSTDNFEAWGYFNKGYSHFNRYTKRDNAKARDLCERALKLDPKYVPPLRIIAFTYLMDISFGWSKSPRQSMERAIELAQKALTIDESDAGVHALLAYTYLLRRQHDEAIAEAERAINLDPNFAIGYSALADTMYYSGRYEEAIAMIKTAMRLHGPYFPAYFWLYLANSHREAGRFEEAISVYKKIFDRSQKGEGHFLLAQLGLAVTYIRLGKEEEARAYAAEVLKINPKYSLEGLRSKSRFKDPAHMERYLDALRKAGIPEKPPLPLPDKPSIAVLPFANISGDPEQEYFADGMTEEIITALSKTPQLFVIARNSTFTYKGKPVKVQQVGRELGVRYVLEGSVRKAGDRVRITAQLVDAATGNHLRAERYDRDLKDIFAVQDEITLKIITSLQVKLTEGEYARMVARGTNNIDAYLGCLKARQILRRVTKEEILLSRKMLKEVIALDPKYPGGYIYLGYTHLADAFYRWSKSPEESLARAEELARKAIELDDILGLPHSLLADIYRTRRQWDKSVAEAERAVSIDPNHMTMYRLANNLRFAGRHEESIAWYEKAMRLDPIPPAMYLHAAGISYFMAQRYEEALAVYKRVLDRANMGEYNRKFAHLGLAQTYAMLGQDEEARAHAAEVLKIDPNYSLERAATWHRKQYRNQADIDPIINARRKAGLPE